MTDEQKVEAELLLDRLIYGNSFWHVIDGKKYRVHPENVYFDRKGVPRSHNGCIPVHADTSIPVTEK